jgi:hypothetical protein
MLSDKKYHIGIKPCGTSSFACTFKYIVAVSEVYNFVKMYTIELILFIFQKYSTIA